MLTLHFLFYCILITHSQRGISVFFLYEQVEHLFLETRLNDPGPRVLDSGHQVLDSGFRYCIRGTLT